MNLSWPKILLNLSNNCSSIRIKQPRLCSVSCARTPEAVSNSHVFISELIYQISSPFIWLDPRVSLKACSRRFPQTGHNFPTSKCNLLLQFYRSWLSEPVLGLGLRL